MIIGALIVVTLSNVIAYTPPTYNSITFTLCSAYTPPTYNSINFTLGDSDACAGADTCTPPASGNNWVVNWSDNCTISTNTDLGTGNLTITDTIQNYCYQESANVSTTCGGLSTGSYRLNDTDWFNGSYNYDENWSSYGISSYNSGASDFYINYSKPQNASMHSLWQVKSSYGTFNNSIPSGCWNQEPLQFIIRSSSVPSHTYITTYCYDGSSNITINSYSDSGKNVYEEAMNWIFYTGTFTLNANLTLHNINMVPSGLVKFQQTMDGRLIRK